MTQTIRLSAIEGIGTVPAPSDLPSGPSGDRRLGPYLLLETLGSGASATVFRARHGIIGVERALKVLRPPACAWPEQRDRFLREARVAAGLRHPNVVAVHDCGCAADGTPFIVMEYVAGRSLAARLGDGVPAPAETLLVAAQLAAALDHAHALGVVHRDIKPANVLLGADGAVRLGDFGIAHVGGDAPAVRPDPSGPGPWADPWAGLGTPAYMAPEQCLAQGGGLGSHTDVYGLSVVLYEMLTGRTPYGAGGAAIDGHLGAQPPAPRTINPYLPAAVDRVLASGLARDPRLRPASAGALVAGLAGAMDEDSLAGVRAVPASWAASVWSGAPLPDPAVADQPTLAGLRDQVPPSVAGDPPARAGRMAALLGLGPRR